MNSLTQADYQQAAKALGVDVATVKAVTVVESSGKGFLDDGRIVLRYEPHIFHRYTDGKFSKSHPDLSYPEWRPGNPKDIEHSYRLFTAAAKLNGWAAGVSCSYGLFQVMGFNFSACGCKTFKEFYNRVTKSEAEQLLLFVQYIKTVGLDDELRAQKWAAFAEAYNGKQFKRNNYDTKLAKEYERYASTIVKG